MYVDQGPPQDILALELEPRTTEVLLDLGIRECADVAEWSKERLLKAGVPMRSIIELVRALDRVGLRIANEDELFRGETAPVLDAERHAVSLEDRLMEAQAAAGIADADPTDREPEYDYEWSHD